MTKTDRLDWLLRASQEIFASELDSRPNIRGLRINSLAFAIMRRVDVPEFYNRTSETWKAAEAVKRRVGADLRELAKKQLISADRGFYTFYTEAEKLNIARYGSPTHPVDRAARQRQYAANLIRRAKNILRDTQKDLTRVLDHPSDDLFTNAQVISKLCDEDLRELN